MQTNTDITYYHKTDKGYFRRVIYGVFWDAVKSSNVIKSGMVNADSAKCFIPLQHVGTLEVNTGNDLIVLGVNPFEFDNTSEQTKSACFKSLTSQQKVFTVSSCDAKLYGSPHMQHYLLSCK